MTNSDRDDKAPRTRASLLYVLVALIAIAAICFAYQYDSIKKTLRMRLFSISSDYVVRKEELKEITNQAVAQIEINKQESLNAIDNRSKEAILNESSAKTEVVPEDVLKAVNKARRETR